MKAINYRPLADILADLSKPIPREHCVTKPRKDKTFPGTARFIVALGWEGTVALMNQIAPSWSFVFPHPPQQIGNYLSITARVSIPTSDSGTITREMSGAVELKAGDLKDGYGDPVTTAAHKAVRKALAYFGFGIKFELPEIYMELKPNGKIPKYDERKAVDKWKYYGKGGQGNKHAQNTPERSNPSSRPNTPTQARSRQEANTGPSLADLKKAYYDVGITIGSDRDRLGPIFHGMYAGPDSLAGVLSSNQLDEGSQKVLKILGAILSNFPPSEYTSPEAVHRSARAFIQRTIEDGLILDRPTAVKEAIEHYKTPE